MANGRLEVDESPGTPGAIRGDWDLGSPQGPGAFPKA